jgi:Domain of unknown function (DUF5666)
MKKIIIIVVLLLVVALAAFYGGMIYGKNSVQSSRQQFFQANAGAGFQRSSNARGQGGAGFVMGEVVSKDDKSITLKLQDNSSKIVFFSDATSVSKTDQGSMDDISVGQQIMVQGQQNSDGSYTAQIIQQRENLPAINANQ